MAETAEKTDTRTYIIIYIENGRSGVAWVRRMTRVCVECLLNRVSQSLASLLYCTYEVRATIDVYDGQSNT